MRQSVFAFSLTSGVFAIVSGMSNGNTWLSAAGGIMILVYSIAYFFKQNPEEAKE